MKNDSMNENEQPPEKISIRNLFKSHPESKNEEESDVEEHPVVDALDNDILMHRDAHFGGQFSEMLDYYQQEESKGIRDDFKIERIRYLAELEKQVGQNLATMLLSGPEAERVGEARTAYKSLRDLYEKSNKKNNLALLVANLILAENDQEASEAIAAIEKEKSAIVPLLIDLIRSDDFHDPLFPGYGLAPQLAVECLGKIGDKRALIALFETIGQDDFFADEQVLKAIHAIGEPAKQFLLKVVKGRPCNEDNEKAAMALIDFKDDPVVAENALKLLQEPEFLKDEAVATYLVMACEGLQDPSLRDEFRKLANKVSKTLKLDIETISKGWKKGQ